MNNIIRDDIRKNVEPYIKEKFRIDELIEIGGYQNFVYEGKMQGMNYVFRITEEVHRSKSELNAEMEFINKIYEGGAPACKPEKLFADDFVHRLEGIEGNYFLCIFYKAEGGGWREVEQRKEHIMSAGRALGKMHKIEKKSKKKHQRENWRENGYLKGAEKLIEDSELLFKMEELKEKLGKFPTTKAGYGLIHGDYLYCNLIYGDRGITVIDFDECEYNWFVYDIAVYMFYYLLGGDPKNIDIESNERLFKNFMVGYKEEYDLEEYWFENINYFFRLREFVLLSSIYRSAKTRELGKWEKDFIETAEYRIKNDTPFVDIDFKKLYRGCCENLFRR